MILPKPLHDKIKKRIAILEDFINTAPKDLLHHEKLSLYVGRPGMLLIRALIAHRDQSALQVEKARADFDFILDELQEAEFILTPFSSGIAGIAFALEYALKHKVLDEELADIIEEIDDTVEGDVANLIAKNNYDLLHGVLGSGVYLIRKKRFEEVKRIITSLQKEVIESDNELKWKRFDAYKTEKYIYDLGFAHGNAGTLFFLGFAYKNNIETEVCKSLIKGLFAFYNNNIQDIEATGSYFAYSYDADTYDAGEKDLQRSRVAWCYGDLGTLVTLIQVALWINDTKSAKRYEQLLEKTTQRIDEKDTEVVDACFCHGSAGNAFLYKHAFELTKNKKFEEAALYWLNDTVNIANIENAQTGYHFLVGTRDEDPYQEDFPGLLEGFLGVYLVFQSFLTNDDKLVKELFFLG